MDQIPIIDIDKLYIEDKIGEGMSGYVFEGLYDNKDIICKSFNINKFSNLESLKDTFEEEILNYNQTQNIQSIVQMIGYYINKEYSQYYIILLDNHANSDLYKYIKHFQINQKKDPFQFSLQSQLKISLNISLAILNLHNKNFVHCDLKPDNIIIDQYNNITIIDLGALIKLDRDYIYSEYILGTPGYMGKEQHVGHIGKSCDIYSLGVTLLELFQGIIPYNNEKQYRKEILQQCKLLKQEYPHIEKIIKSCIHSCEYKRPKIKTIVKNLQNIQLFKNNLIYT